MASTPRTADERQQSKLASLRDLADLARAGSAVIRQPLMQVTFEVHHVVDRPGYLADYVARKPSRVTPDGNGSFGETLTTGADGLGLVIVTRTSVALGSRRQYKSGGRTQCEVMDGNESRIFRGTAFPNPSFIYDTAWKYEGLICVDADALRARKWHSRVLRDVVHQVAKLARDAQAPIISLQAPAQVPPTDSAMRYTAPSHEEDILPAASSLAVRFAIALQRPDAATVLTITEKLAQYCGTHGFGLWVADTRPGTRSGNWFAICPNSPELTARLSTPTESGYVKRCLPVTLVGPARIGSTYALASFLSQFKEIGFQACSVVSLDELIFVHLELAFSGTRPELLDKVDKEFNASAASAASARLPSDALIQVLRILGRDRVGDHERTGLLVNSAGDYQCLLGPSRPVAPRNLQSRMAVWFSWQAQGADIDIAVPLNGLLQALSDVQLLERGPERFKWRAGAPNIDYLVCRNMGNSILRGKGKLSVVKDAALRRYPYDGPEPRPTELCVSIEEAWRARSAVDGRRAIRELTVAWRECWLGHWSLPL